MTIELSIRDLNELIDGKLRLGSTPPLGGEFEPIGRLVPAGGELRKGDVVVPQFELESLEADDECNSGGLLSEYCPEESFIGGALGIISSREVCPWSGCFSIQVDDLEGAIWQFLDQVRSQEAMQNEKGAGNRLTVAVFDERGESPVIESLRSSGLTSDTNLRLAWQCLQWQPNEEDERTPVIVQVRGSEEYRLAHHLFTGGNNVAIITEYANEELASGMQSEEMEGTTEIISCASDESLTLAVVEKLERLRNERIA